MTDDRDPRTFGELAKGKGPRAKAANLAGEHGLQVAADMRELVLKYPDLADRLMPDPVSKPSLWTGFIPPLMIDGGLGGWRTNPSPIRTELVAICREAIRREHGEREAHDWYLHIQTDNWSHP